jgi:NAD(P)-dependent dehydrogenase (short-subunit alcohol dehydrogenase family)
MPDSTSPLTVVIHGAGGAIGSATAEAFAARGAHLYLAGRRLGTLDGVAERARSLGAASVALDEVDAYDEDAVEAHASSVAREAGGIDVMLNAVGIPLVQGVPLVEIGLDDVLAPATSWLRTQFITSRAAARHMTHQGSGTILTLSASPARMSLAGVSGFAAACAAVEALTRTFAAEVGPSGVRAVCIRPQRIADTIGSIPDLPMPIEDFTTFLEGLTTSRSLPSLADVASTAVFLAEGGARSMNGAVVNLTCGMSAD